jgi:hypothetical protein
MIRPSHGSRAARLAMTDFDPNHDPENGDEADAYVGWCADQFTRLSDDSTRTFRTAVRCAHWLLVVSLAQLRLDEMQEVDEFALMEQLGHYNSLARAIERQRNHYPIERLIVMRSTLDCWEPVGCFADNVLTAAKCAVSALMLIELHPLVDLWELPAEDAWALLIEGREQLAIINGYNGILEVTDMSVKRDENVTAKFTWQRANNISRRVGAPPPSAN